MSEADRADGAPGAAARAARHRRRAALAARRPGRGGGDRGRLDLQPLPVRARLARPARRRRRDYADRGVRFLAVNSNDAERYPADAPEAMRERVRARALAVSVPVRRDQEAARAWGARTTPHLFVLDPELRIVYEGAPDADHQDPRCGAEWLRDALDAVLDGGEPPAEHRAGRLLDQVEARRARTRRADAMTARRRLVRVPASSANLGPGYDVLAAALALELELEVSETGRVLGRRRRRRPARPTARTSACARSSACTPPTGCGSRSAARSRSPAGLGSSAAAIVAGLVAADHLFELGLERDEIYRHAVELEGHPDNVAAALYGGFVALPAAPRTASCRRPCGSTRPRASRRCS